MAMTVLLSPGIKKTFSNFRRGTFGRPLLIVGANAMKEEVVETFIRQSDPVTGRAWAPNRPLTKRSKKDGRILRDTGALYASIVNTSPKVFGNSVSIGTSLPYAKTQQEGATLPNSKIIPTTVRAKAELRKGRRPRAGEYVIAKDGIVIPARRFLGWGQRGTTRLVTALSDFIFSRIS